MEQTQKPEIAIKIVDLNKSYGKHQVIKGLNLDVFRGEIFWVCWHKWGGQINNNRLYDWRQEN